MTFQTDGTLVTLTPEDDDTESVCSSQPDSTISDESMCDYY